MYCCCEARPIKLTSSWQDGVIIASIVGGLQEATAHLAPTEQGGKRQPQDREQVVMMRERMLHLERQRLQAEVGQLQLKNAALQAALDEQTAECTRLRAELVSAEEVQAHLQGANQRLAKLQTSE